MTYKERQRFCIMLTFHNFFNMMYVKIYKNKKTIQITIHQNIQYFSAYFLHTRNVDNYPIVATQLNFPSILILRFLCKIY